MSREAAVGRALTILLDLLMPVMNGCEFHRQQRREPQRASIPVAIRSLERTSSIRQAG
jgi:CheY-like chemotaxis protein